MKFPNISLGRSTKTYTHNMSFDNSTTMPFGVVQPLMSQRLEPKSKISVDMRQLVRLAPMPVPTFARLFMNNEVSFVPTVDVCPYYEALVSQLSYSGTDKTYYPTELPQTSNSTLLYYLLCCDDVRFTIYDINGKQYLPSADEAVKVTKIIFEEFFGVGSYNKQAFQLLADTIRSNNTYDVAILPTGCDFFFENHNQGTGIEEFSIAFRFGPSTRRLRSVLIGLGYSLNIDNTPVSLIPLLSFYKAWFDLYYPVRDLSWTNTNAYKLVRFIEDYKYSYIFSLRGFSNVYDKSRYGVFLAFLADLSNVFFVAPDDIVSIHRDTPNLSTNSILSYIDYGGQVGKVTCDGPNELPYLPSASNVSLISLQVLQRLTRYFNKNSVIGKRISEYVKVHFGSDVANSLYKDAFHVSSFTFPLTVDDIFSTSDTFEQVSDTHSKGELLGSFAGKGIGYDKSHIEFTAPSAGYFFVLSSISTPTGYFQGNSGDLYVTNFDTVPQDTFDALGFELTPRGQFFGFNDIYLSENGEKNFGQLGTGFGFVPRYTGLKYHKNIVNGDMSRLGTSASLSPYHLNRILTPSSVRLTSVTKTDDGYAKIALSTKQVQLPGSTTAWRFLTSQEWLGNYNRIFYNEGDLYPHNPYQYGGNFGSDDNFIVQTVFESKVTNMLKPLSQSFDTYEESTDNGSIDVKPE